MERSSNFCARGTSDLCGEGERRNDEEMHREEEEEQEGKEEEHRRVGADTDSLTITGSHTPLTIPRASLRCPGLGKLL